MAVALLAFFMLGGSAPAGTLPKPDPPPKAAPPPPPPPPPPPVAPEPVAPPPVAPVAVAPVVVHPTAAEQRAVAKRRATARRTKLRAARLERAAALKRATAALERATAVRVKARERATTQLSPRAAGASSSSPSALPYLLVAFGAALLMLALALTPARAVPWSRAARVLQDRRDELGVLGAMSFLATVLFFLLVQVTT